MVLGGALTIWTRLGLEEIGVAVDATAPSKHGH